jgi:hypothetical protein
MGTIDVPQMGEVPQEVALTLVSSVRSSILKSFV